MSGSQDYSPLKSPYAKKLMTMVMDYFDGDSDKVRSWYWAENPELGNVSPMEMICGGRAKRVYEIFVAARSDEFKVSYYAYDQFFSSAARDLPENKRIHKA